MSNEPLFEIGTVWWPGLAVPGSCPLMPVSDNVTAGWTDFTSSTIITKIWNHLSSCIDRSP